MALKAEGNLAFARGDFTAAVALYSRALDTPIATPDLPCEGGRRVAYLLNRAQAYLKRAPTTPDPAAPPDECASPGPPRCHGMHKQGVPRTRGRACRQDVPQAYAAVY